MLAAVCMAVAGCARIPGRPGPGPEVVRPEQVLDFPALYKQNCAACHGENGRDGAAISLANPVYIAVAGENQLSDVIANGVPGKLMPAFAKSAGGMLTDGQVSALAQGIVKQWGNPSLLAGPNPPPYRSALLGNAENGLQAYQVPLWMVPISRWSATRTCAASPSQAAPTKKCPTGATTPRNRCPRNLCP